MKPSNIAALLAAFKLNVQDFKSIIPETLFDRKKLVSGAVPGQIDFQVGSGQGGKTDHDTNAPNNGQFPSKTYFLLTAISLAFLFQGKPSASSVGHLDDIHMLGTGGHADFLYANQVITRKGPLGSLPPEFGENGAVATAIPDAGAAISLALNSWRGNSTALSLLIRPSETFGLKVTPEALALASDIHAYAFMHGLKLIAK